MNNKLLINPERIAYWFFRLNGCLTIENFVVHPDMKGSQRTDVDILAVRFPYRAELLTSNAAMKDHCVFGSVEKVEIIFAEVKHGPCRLNGPWTNPPDENIHRVLYAVGAFPTSEVPRVAKSLYENQYYIDDRYAVRLFAVGMSTNLTLPNNVTQLIWVEILEFIYDRFHAYQKQKAHHPQWDSVGDLLYRLIIKRPKIEFINMLLQGMENWCFNKN